MGGSAMTQAEKQKKTFLSVCGKHDNDLLTGKEDMTQAEFERITYLTSSLGYSQYTQMLIATYLDFAYEEAERIDRKMDILIEYPQYWEDENEYEKTEKWLDDFLNQVPEEKREHFCQIIKENTQDI